MAYKNQEKCPSCGISVTAMPEDASYEEMLCNLCYEKQEHIIAENHFETIDPDRC